MKHNSNAYEIQAASQNDRLDEFLPSNLPLVEDRLSSFGFVLLRGFAVNGTDDFQLALNSLGLANMDYTYRSTPRTSISTSIFTATEYPHQQEIPLHSENAYQKSWPLKIAFYCSQPAERGGATTIADLREVTRALGSDMVTALRERGVRYTRHYHEFIDLPWQTVFQTEDRHDVEIYCQRNNLDFRWLDQNCLRTTQKCQGTAMHPRTGEEVFFNQAHLFHPSSLGKEAERSMRAAFGGRLPRNAFYGDGEEIEPATLAFIRRVFETTALDVNWRKGDILLADNMRVAHGRRPFEGVRKVYTSLLEPYAESSHHEGWI